MQKKQNSKNKDITLIDIAGKIDKLQESFGGEKSKLRENFSSEIESLAIMTANGFSNMDIKFEEVKRDIAKVDKKVDDTKKGLDSRISGLSSRIDDAVHNRVNMQQHEHLAGRVQTIENKLAIK